MTTEEIRGELARLAGWNKPGVMYTTMEQSDDMALDARLLARDSMRNALSKDHWWRLNSDGSFDTSWKHPYPLTLDSAASALPVGWKWARWGDGVWVAQRVYPASMLPKDCDMSIIETLDTGDEIRDRFVLAVLCRMAAKGVNP